MTKLHSPRVIPMYFGHEDPSDYITKEVDQLVKSVLEILEGSVFANTPVQLFIFYDIQGRFIHTVTTCPRENRHRYNNRVKTFRPFFDLMNEKIAKMMDEFVDRLSGTEPDWRSLKIMRVSFWDASSPHQLEKQKVSHSRM